MLENVSIFVGLEPYALALIEQLVGRDKRDEVEAALLRP